jgi:hypothetical protein
VIRRGSIQPSDLRNWLKINTSYNNRNLITMFYDVLKYTMISEANIKIYIIYSGACSVHYLIFSCNGKTYSLEH